MPSPTRWQRGSLRAIADELAPSGVALTLLSTTSNDDVAPARDVPMDGALVYSCDIASPALAWLMRRGLPLVFVDQAPAPGITSVNVDDRAGAAAAAAHLVELGHRRIDIVNKNMHGPYGLVLEADADFDVDHHVSRQAHARLARRAEQRRHQAEGRPPAAEQRGRRIRRRTAAARAGRPADSSSVLLRRDGQRRRARRRVARPARARRSLGRRLRRQPARPGGCVPH